MSVYVDDMKAFYNEFDPYAAQWLRNLIAAGLIAPGVVDERSIEDIKPEELRGYTQCHFFAGIGVWSFALRSAGWPDSRPVWTGSCPCQPFSAAGAGAGFTDERHLWPAFHHLIAECNPPVVLGEQVASSLVDPWVDLVHADLEALGYAFGGVPFPAAGIGAPHIRDRLYWVAHAEIVRREGQHVRAGGGLSAFGTAHIGGAGGLADTSGERHHRGGAAGTTDGARGGWAAVEGRGQLAVGLDHAHLAGLEGQRGGYQAEGGRIGAARPVATPSESGGLANADGVGRQGHEGAEPGIREGQNEFGTDRGGAIRPGPTNGYWRAADWLGCRDGKWRPVEPGTFPLVNGPAGRVGRGGPDWRTAAGEEGKGHRAGRLKGYGNAINAEAARVFIECVMGAL